MVLTNPTVREEAVNLGVNFVAIRIILIVLTVKKGLRYRRLPISVCNV